MSAAARPVPAPAREVAARWLMVAGCAALVVRPLFAHAATLAALYVLLFAAALVLGGVRRAPVLLSPVVVLAAGIAAVFVARAVAGLAPPVRGGAVAAALSVLAAVAEEAFFRGYAYGRLRRWGTPAAVVGSAVLFAVVHLPGYGAAAFPVDLGAGMLLSWQRWASGRWEIPAATHVFANLSAIF